MSDEAATPAAPPPAAPPPRFLAWLARRPYWVLAVACLILWLPGILSLPALDRDESRFAESSRQMLDSGNFIDIRFGQVPRYKKPVGIYWAQAATTALAGHVYAAEGDHRHIWTYRLPSLLGGIAAVWLTCWCGSLFGAEIGLLAALLMGGSILLTAEANIATTDAVLLACILGMQGVLFRIYRSSSPVAVAALAMRRPEGGTTSVALAGWAALALGILVKGPVAPAIAAVTIAVLIGWDRWRPGTESRDWRWLKHTKPLPGVILALLIVLPWLIAIALESHGAFFQQSLGDDFAAKVAGGQESHGAPPGYFLITAAISFWPAILFILPGVGLGIARRNETDIRFLLAWAGGCWAMFELVPTKLPHYVLPAYPALAILAALWLLSSADDQTGWQRWLPRIAALQFLLGLVALTAAPVLLPHLYGTVEDWGAMASRLWWLPTGAGATALSGLVALVLFLKGKRLGALIPALLALLVAVLLLTVGTAPQLTQLWVSQNLAALVARDRDINDPPPVLAGYTEPSLVFALGADVGLTDGRGAAQWGAGQGGLALVDDSERPQFLAHLAELQADADIKDELSGFNYSRGKPVHVTIYRVTGLHDLPASPRP